MIIIKTSLLSIQVEVFCLKEEETMTKLHHQILISGIVTESGEVMGDSFEYEHVGYSGQPLVVVHALTGNH